MKYSLQIGFGDSTGKQFKWTVLVGRIKECYANSDCMNAPPRLFVSYSWSTPEHEQWVLDFATQLRESEVDVILDKWDLKEGHDAIAFMERMVTDPTIKKVILVCDRTYVTKADGRDGGVGTETQIISAEVYAKQAQDKFVAVTVERDDDGNLEDNH